MPLLSSLLGLKLPFPFAPFLASVAALAVAIAPTSQAGERIPVDYVDPMIGVDGAGSCMPGSCLPNSSIYPSPDTLDVDESGYVPGSPIVGFSQLHTQGTGGVPSYGNFLVSPQIGVALAEKDHASPKSNEKATAIRYDVTLDLYGIDCSVTPSRNSAIYRFKFPKSSDACLLFDVARKIKASDALLDGNVTVDRTQGIISGGGTFGGNWAPGEYKLYFYAQVNRVPSAAGTWKNDKKSDAVNARGTKEPLGAWLKFDTTRDDVVELKIAVSFKSVEQAKAWLEQQIPEWDFKAVETKAREIWTNKLDRIEIDGANDEEMRRLYTALWHCFVQPRDRTGDSPEGLTPYWDDQYTLWDSWKTLFPLLAIIDPGIVRDTVNSFIARQRLHGQVATAFIQGSEYKVGQGGDEADNIVADAFVKKVPGINWNDAYAMLRQHAETGRTGDYRKLGFATERKDDYCFRTRSGSSTLGFAYNDFAVAQVARGLGKQTDARRYLERAGNWKNIWDSSLVDGEFAGFPRAKNSHGEFSKTEARKGYNTDFYEATCWISSYAPTFAIPELVEIMGGKDKFISRLEYGLKNDLIDFGNEPSFMTIWLFCAVGRPDLASFWANKLLEEYKGNSLPGDDDQGAMSSLFIFLNAGFFPFAAQDVYFLHGPRIPQIAFRLPNGRTFTIVGHNAAAENLYVQSATLNGKPLEHAWISHGDLSAGGRLEFVMGSQPSTWGQDKAASPESAKKPQ